MATVTEHYDNLLADYYSWMFGDFNAKVATNREFFNALGIIPQGSGVAVDLGAGSGFQSLALAQLGFRVLAVDLSRKLLDELQSHSGALPVTAIHDDLLNFPSHCQGKVELCVCMGDTLPHLATLAQVAELFGKIYRALEGGGKFVLTFRDMTLELKGLERFIPVRSDANTIFTCFLEYEPEHVRVHDLVYTRNQDKWELRKGSYLKLRIPLPWVTERLKEAGFSVGMCENKNGMITTIAERPAE